MALPIRARPATAVLNRNASELPPVALLKITPENYHAHRAMDGVLREFQGDVSDLNVERIGTGSKDKY